jgi:SAM-dependent methyltransferase
MGVPARPSKENAIPAMTDPGFDEHARKVQASYDAVARAYADAIYDELKGKPFDREQLDRFADRVRGRGLVCDLGCGPAQLARYLRDRGVSAFGLDLSEAMLAEARQLNPDLGFVLSSMLALGVRSDSLAGIAAFYSIIHIPRDCVLGVFSELARVLRREGALLLAFHVGSGEMHHAEFLGKPVNFDATLFATAEITGWLEVAGLRVEKALERDPYPPDVEYQSRRGYVLAVKPE